MQDFATIIDCDPKYLSRLASGSASPSRRLAKEIKAITNGLIDLPARPRKKKKQEEHDQSQPN